MKLSLIALASVLVIFIFGAALAQERSTSQKKIKKLFWSQAPTCGQKNAEVTADDNFKCSLIMKDDWRHLRFEYKGLTLTGKFFTQGNYLGVELKFDNESDKPINFDTRELMVVYFSDESAFNSGQKPVSVSSAVTRNSASLHAQEVTNESRPQTTYNEANRSIADRNAPEPSPIEAGVLIPGSPNLSSRTSVSVFKGNVLVPPKKEVKGLVYFNLYRQSDFRFVSVPVEDVYYVFPYPKIKK